MRPFSVHLIPVLSDNYIFILRDEVNDHTFCVDPAEGPSVSQFLEKNGWTLDYILLTHHHLDHIGGTEFLRSRYSPQIYASTYDKHRIPADHYVSDGENLFLGKKKIRVLFLPGHTLGHIAYFFEDDESLFSGDVLFSLGCGRLFEGSFEQMLNSLQKIKFMPEQTKIYCTHEYSQRNAQFALKLEPNNKALIARSQEIATLRGKNLPTIPTTLKSELECNPFLRAHSLEIRNNIEKKEATDLEVFSEVRQRRNNF